MQTNLKSTILVIDDEAAIRKLLRITLELEGFKVVEGENGREGIRMAASFVPDLILLDYFLPDMLGQEVLEELRLWFKKPIVLLSANDTEDVIVRALETGATDYLFKPFRNGELLARIRNVMRQQHSNDNKIIYEEDGLWIDYQSHEVKIEGISVHLTATEFRLLTFFIQHKEKALTHQTILKEIWGVGHQEDTQYLRVFIGTLRKKIEPNPSKPRYIQTLNGIGYRFG